MNKIKTKLIPVVIASSLIAGLTAGTVQSPAVQAAGKPATLSDIAGHWAFSSIQSAITKGVVDGYPDGTFKPDQGISRAEFITMLSKALNQQAGAAGEDWFAPYVAGLQQENVIYAGQFDDYNAPMTRLELATVALRAIKEEFRVPEGAENADASKVMYNAVGSGLIQGMAGGALEPEGQTTRAQSTTIIDRVLRVKNGETLPTDEAAKELSELAATGTNLRSTKNVTPARRMPITYDVPYGTMTIKEIIFIDTDKESPFRWMLDGLTRHGLGDGSFNNSYVLVYKVKFNIKETPQIPIRIADFFNMVGWDINYKGGFTETQISKTGEFETYRIYAIDKIKYKGLDFSPSYNVMNENFPVIAVNLES
ncbi:S-layer homology domain-containing protein [Paenibacillus sp. TAB 01]|uniref:S-layer homology domain-containing protein n=1 Tax=Paenibacillus sp. TAB 01 TaxID=3368988 RepID=UPI003750EE4B